MKHKYLITLLIAGMYIIGFTSCASQKSTSVSETIEPTIRILAGDEKKEKTNYSIKIEENKSEQSAVTVKSPEPAATSKQSRQNVELQIPVVPSTTQPEITEADAKQIALAQVPGASDSDIRLHLDWDDGRLIYEGSIFFDIFEYEFEIDARDGRILDWEKEFIFDD